MNEIFFDPPICHFVIFSGGGGLIEREAEVELDEGENRLKVRGVPASFDPETFMVKVAAAEARGLEPKLQEIVFRIPNRQYVEDNLRREGDAARRLIAQSVDVGVRRPQMIDICEEIAHRTYLDEEVELTIWVIAPKEGKATVSLSYFINDARFRWKPTITVELGEGEVRVRGFVALTNDSAHRFANVEISFADFARELDQDAQNYRVAPEEMKAQLRKQIVKNMVFK
jgi:hypothetical protein